MRTDEEFEFTVLLEGLNAVEAALAVDLLEGEGIPSMSHGPDHDVGELGLAAHAMTRGTDLLVPHAAAERARVLLEESGFGSSPHRPASPEAWAKVRRLQVRGLALVVAVLLAAALGFEDTSVLKFGLAGLAVLFLLEALDRRRVRQA